MASTSYPVNHPLAVKHWANELMVEALKKTSFSQFIGKSSGALCQVRTELGSKAGDRVRFGIRYQLAGTGTVGDETLEGNEENLVTYSDNVTINQTRHAVRSEGKMSEQRVPFNVRSEARDGLADWYANMMDTAFFTQLCGYTAETRASFYGHNTATVPDSDHWVTSAATISEGALQSTSTFSLSGIDTAVERAKTLRLALRPLDLGRGMKKWVMFLHPYQVTALRANTATGQWLDIQKAALSGSGSTNNPIYTGALGEYNGVVLHESTRIPAGTSTTRRAVLCGAQAMACAYGMGSGGATPYEWHEELFDYGNSLGVAAASIWGMKKTVFNGSDVGSIVLSTYAVAAT